MSAGDVQKVDVLNAFNRVDWPFAELPPDSQQAIQDAAEIAIDALDQLSIECSIASARRTVMQSRETAKRHENLVEELVALRTPR